MGLRLMRRVPKAISKLPYAGLIGIVGAIQPAGVQAFDATSASSVDSKCVPGQFTEVRVAHAIALLPEVQERTKRLVPPQSLVVGVGSMATARLLNGRCYQEVAIYVNLGDHLEKWLVLLIDTSNKVSKVLNSDGDYVSLREWRSQLQRTKQSKQ